MAALVFSGSGVHADPLPTDKLSESAQKAFDQGKFKKAADAWIRAVKTLEDGGQRDLFFESCLKRLGQAYRRLQLTADAYKTLKQAFDICNALGVEDKELASELSELSTAYRPVDVTQLGPETAAAFKKANVTEVGLLRASDNAKMQVNLEDRFEKHLDNDTVDGIALEKKITVDVDEASDGTVSMLNIKGFKIHAKEKNIWVNLLQAVIKPADAQGQHPAEVTAGKMGVTKTVSASLPAKGYQPLAELLAQLRAMVTPMPVRFASVGVDPVGASTQSTLKTNLEPLNPAKVTGEPETPGAATAPETPGASAIATTTTASTTTTGTGTGAGAGAGTTAATTTTATTTAASAPAPAGTTTTTTPQSSATTPASPAIGPAPNIVPAEKPSVVPVEN
jgi:hypothetical protein